MKHKVFFLCIVGLLTLSSPQDLFAQKVVSKEILDSILLIRGEKSAPCATAFLLDSGEVVTNAHVSRSLCPFGTCTGIKAYRSAGPGSRATDPLPTTLKLEFELKSLDVAIFRQEQTPPIKGAIKRNQSPAKFGGAMAIGFPRCGELRVAEGEIAALGPVHELTTIQGSHGSSGSPVLDSNFELVGIVDQSSSLGGALGSLAWGGYFNLRAVRSAAAFSVIEAAETAGFESEANLLREHIAADVRRSGGNERIKKDLLLMSMVDGFRTRVLVSNLPPELKLYLLHLGEYPSELARFRPPPLSGDAAKLGPAFDRLIAAYNSEMKGPFSDLLRAIDFAPLRDAINKSGRSPEEAEAIYKIIADNEGELGFELLMGGKVLFYILIFLLVSTLVFFSLGYVYAKLTGGFWRKTVLTTLIGMFWPFSLIWFWWSRR